MSVCHSQLTWENSSVMFLVNSTDTKLNIVVVVAESHSQGRACFESDNAHNQNKYNSVISHNLIVWNFGMKGNGWY